jgi:hypothetical protein
MAIKKGDVKNLAVAPSQATLQVGQTLAFHLMDTDGLEETNVEWSVSAPEAFDGQAGSGVLHPGKPGTYTLVGTSPNGQAQARVTVNAATRPPEAAVWTAAEFAGCTVALATPPAEGEVAAYGQEQCPDGQYVSAYTVVGAMLSRHKLTAGEMMPQGKSIQSVSTASAAVATPLSLHSGSVCDAVQAGDPRSKIVTLLKQRSLRYSAESLDVWIVAESKVQCRLWFEDGMVVKKRKVLVTD